MGLKCGIVGLPNVGKSTIFNAITKAGAQMANYPFCTIEPNHGVVEVPDVRLNRLKDLYKPDKVIPAIIEFVDIAGLVRGASEGEGLGNKFLSHIREVDAIVHVLRAFEDGDITHVHGVVDPVEDAAVVNMELIFSDLESLEKQYQKVEKNARSGNKEAKDSIPIMEKLLQLLKSGKPVRAGEYTDEEKNHIKKFQLITYKPVLYCANVKEGFFTEEKNPLLPKIKSFCKSENAEFVILSGKIEEEISTLSLEEQFEFLKDLGLTESGLSRMIQSAYKLLGLITFLTAGKQEVRAWTVRAGSSAPVAAGVIHSDFEKSFIRAEVMKFEDIDRFEVESKVKEEGKLRLEGKDYIIQDGDVVYFRVNA